MGHLYFYFLHTLLRCGESVFLHIEHPASVTAFGSSQLEIFMNPRQSYLVPCSTSSLSFIWILQNRQYNMKESMQSAVLLYNYKCPLHVLWLLGVKWLLSRCDMTGWHFFIVLNFSFIDALQLNISAQTVIWWLWIWVFLDENQNITINYNISLIWSFLQLSEMGWCSLWNS